MKIVLRVSWCGLLFLSFLVFPSYALVLEGVSGSWYNPAGGDLSTVRYTTASVAYGSGTENRIFYGAGGYQSGLGFTGVDVPYVCSVGDIFELGQLRCLNAPTLLGTAISGVDMRLVMTFADPERAAANFGFSFSILNTPNINSGNQNDDFLYFPASFTAETLMVNGKLYVLELLGFGPDASNLISELRTSENSWSSTSLWGRVACAPVKPVPEPAMLILFGSGFLMLAGAWRKPKQ